jgi:hypothetical protein
VDTVPDPLLLKKSGSAGNRTRTSGSVVKKSDHQTKGELLQKNNMLYDVRRGNLTPYFTILIYKRQFSLLTLYMKLQKHN